LRTLFLDLLGRPPAPDERSQWIERRRDELIDSALAGSEFWHNWFEEQLYYFLLVDNFRPTTDGVEAIPLQMASGSLGVRDALHRLCLSSSFDRRNPGPDTFVTVVMEQLLGITVQKNPRELEIGKRLYDGASGAFLGRQGKSQADVVNIAVADARCMPHFLMREYQRLLRQEPDALEITSWDSALQEDALALRSILRGWFLSKAYDHRLKNRSTQPNRLFVRCLFMDLAGRMPTENETQRIRNALDGLADSGPLRSVIARLLLDSGKAEIVDRSSVSDPAVWIVGLFERLLGRSPRPEELDTFLRSFKDPACRTETVLYAIVSHPEYQTW